MTIKLVVKDDGLWINFNNNSNGKKALISLSSIAMDKVGIVRAAMQNSISEFIELCKLAKEYDYSTEDNVFEQGHPIFKMAKEIDDLKAEIRLLTPEGGFGVVP